MGWAQLSPLPALRCVPLPTLCYYLLALLHDVAGWLLQGWRARLRVACGWFAGAAPGDGVTNAVVPGKPCP